MPLRAPGGFAPQGLPQGGFVPQGGFRAPGWLRAPGISFAILTPTAVGSMSSRPTARFCRMPTRSAALGLPLVFVAWRI